MSILERILERRTSPRRRERLWCDLYVEGRAYRGRVTDLSPRGLFVQTDARPAHGTPIRVRLLHPDGRATDLWATLAHRRQVARSLASIARDGLGLCIHRTDAPLETRELPRTRPAASDDEDVIELVEVVS